MKYFVLITLLIIVHTTTATIDIEKLRENAAAKVQTLQDQTAATLQKVTDSIDFGKILQIVVPIVQQQQKIFQQYQDQLGNIPAVIQSQGEKLRGYYQKLHGLTGRDLVLAFHTGVPWPAWRRMDDE
ncbi:uncharacterized protein LOC113516508 [Galleria mellonella]|uniref:Uncharacterized protein LOC113516508 n=1 Tax=Galleria mellonella TaxID=7137 RepID=A0A6J1WVG7_GALME|nr:uncharacterized protein LOC113516508 [Galleria mellonella]